VETRHGILAAQQVPGRGVAAEGRDLVPGQVTPPTAHAVPRRTAAAAGEYGEAHVLHLVEVEQAWQADHQGKDAGQQTPLQVAGLVAEAVPRRGQPTQGRRQQQESPGVLRLRPEKGGAGSGTGWPGGTVATGRAGVAAAAGSTAAGGRAGARCCRPYFFRKRYRATRETRTSQVRWMKSRTS